MPTGSPDPTKHQGNATNCDYARPGHVVSTTLPKTDLEVLQRVQDTLEDNVLPWMSCDLACYALLFFVFWECVYQCTLVTLCNTLTLVIPCPFSSPSLENPKRPKLTSNGLVAVDPPERPTNTAPTSPSGVSRRVPGGLRYKAR